MRRTLVIVDDIVTTGATLAAATSRLREVNVQVTGAAVLAATQLRTHLPAAVPVLPPVVIDGVYAISVVPRTRGDGEASAR
jgi:adenine/guanine phosphoribosyltransferase-like PRPP-binding protein